MADSILYILHRGPRHSPDWRETQEMILTGAAFGLQSTVWITNGALRALSQLAAPQEQLQQLQAFAVRCVASAEALAEHPLEGVEPLSAGDLHHLQDTSDQTLVF
ncbi:DsrE family protein [Alloalcanivorax xenomutans]|uniref:DsrE family protein n=1 Tax=Alloalcanivorax xenomutans TaxID=1094342 RepID=A0A9Q3WA53_9GAMM|nr:DsrE family protein [Alloalcanivorax xenomutans]MBA4720694.1 DsrE family protein [Alcanivorax sp.]MCE7511238.1 DsrE family protein [Alloalcanivorax xenomutans]MCE7525926.1 DsrE family protein [Alloalcanivorax xenomutans]WOA33354.1 DsrE family protein [Alloalcanivorax xenomutans]WOD30308.1 DsrE family protein [Alloalcanivorax xenomutans]